MRNFKVNHPCTLVYEKWPDDKWPHYKHPTKCWESIEKLSKFKFVCPLEMENYLKVYSEFWEYSLTTLDQHIKRGYKESRFLSGIGHEHIKGFKEENKWPLIEARLCLRCKESKFQHLKCQICAGLHMPVLDSCKSEDYEKSFFKESQFFLKNKRICTTWDRCFDMWFFYTGYPRANRDFKASVSEDDDLILNRSVFVASRYVEMYLNNKRRNEHERRKKEFYDSYREAKIRREKDGSYVGWIT